MWFRDGLKRTEKNEAGEVKGPGMIDDNATEPPSMNEETNDIDSMMAELRAAMEDPKPILINQVCYALQPLELFVNFQYISANWLNEIHSSGGFRFHWI